MKTFGATNDDILIVDDNPQNVTVLSMLLKSQGYKTRTSKNGYDALKEIENKHPQLILLDIKMPGLDGLEVCKQLKENPQTAPIPIIFVTAYDDPETRAKAFAAGGVDCISKPIDQDEVLARVRAQWTICQYIKQMKQVHAHDHAILQTMAKMKEDFIESMTHDLKSPISAIRLSIDLMRRVGLSDEKKLLHYLSEIDLSLNTMQRLVTDVLELTQIEASRTMEKREINLETIIHQTLNDKKRLADAKHIELIFENTASDSIIESEPRSLRIIFENLITNALKYSNNNSKIQIHLKKQNQNFVFQIQDEGFGISEPDLPKIFNRFYRGQNNQNNQIEGTGLGLAMVKAMVEQHKGHISVQSTLGTGTTFIVTLPALSDESASATS